MKVCSLFSGIGGIDLGFQQAGFDIVWANEFDKDAAKTYRHNFGDDHLVESDIRSIDPHKIPDFNVLVAGFPCQPFSKMGKQRGFEDPRGTLFFEIARIAKEKEMLNDGASIVALTYFGSEKSVEGYNVMGVAKAALETSIKYLAKDLGKDNIRIIIKQE